MAQHELISKNPLRKGYDIKLYKFIRANGGWENWDIVVLERFSCRNSLELLEREWTYDDKVNIELNHIVVRDPAKFQKQYYQDNKEKFKEYAKQYREKKKEKIECPTCKCMVGKYDFKRHTKTKKHINNLQTNKT